MFGIDGGVSSYPEDWFSNVGQTGLLYFSRTWFDHYQVMPDDIRNNYFHLVGATKRVSGGNNLLGMTQHVTNLSFIFRERIEEYGAEQGATEQEVHFLCQHNTVHEIGHQFQLNKNIDPGGHDTRAAWCADQCEPGVIQNRSWVMFYGAPTSTDDWDGVNRFCVEDLLTGEPGSPPGQGHSIRGDQDPVKKMEKTR